MEYLQRILPNSFGSLSLAPATCTYDHAPILNSLPSAFADVPAVLLKDNLNYIPGEWKSGDLCESIPPPKRVHLLMGPADTPFYDFTPTDPCVADSFARIKSADFIAWQASFLPIIGPQAKLEVIQVFTPDEHHVHEAPVYLPETNELLYSDTSAVGHLWAIEIDTRIIRQIPLDPPLSNINGATSFAGQVYVATNGGAVRGIHAVNTTSGAVASPALVNSFRGRHLNSPNDLIFDSAGNLYFTDPPYGWKHKWSGVGPPELPPSVYRRDAKTRALTVVSTGRLGLPNGLALSADERTLYVADSTSSSAHPENEREAQRAVWGFEVIAGKEGKGGVTLGAPRLVYMLEAGWPDGLRVTESGLLMVAVMGGVDVVDPETGALLGRIHTPGDVVFNLEPARGKGVWLLTGKRAIYKVTMKEGPVAVSRAAKSGKGLMGFVDSFWK